MSGRRHQPENGEIDRAVGSVLLDGSVHAYCLMGNHYHFVMQTRQANLSRRMRHVNGVYSQAFNRRHGWSDTSKASSKRSM